MVHLVLVLLVLNLLVKLEPDLNDLYYREFQVVERVALVHTRKVGRAARNQKDRLLFFVFHVDHKLEKLQKLFVVQKLADDVLGHVGYCSLHQDQQIFTQTLHDLNQLAEILLELLLRKTGFGDGLKMLLALSEDVDD